MSDLTHSPRVVGTQRADFYDLQAFLKSPQFAGKSGEGLALAIYDYFTDTVDGSYHFWPMDENHGIPRVRNVVHDPLKLLNAYGFMVCGQHAAMLYSVYTAAGFKTRGIGVPGHTLCEVFYDDRWHILDVDMWTWFRAPEGHIASAYELAKNAHALIVESENKSQPCNLPDRTLKDYASMYAETVTVDDHVESMAPPSKIEGHTMDFQLRPGETLIRSQTHQGRFHFPQEWRKNRAKFLNEWRGLPHERYEPFRTFGNGRWIYEPNLAAPSRDVELGTWENSGVKQDAAGLTGEGTISFRIRSPYPFCGTPDWSRDPIAYSNGVWLNLTGSGDVRVEIVNAEEQWKTVFERNGTFDEKVDITALFEGRYDSVIRMTLKSGATLKRFRFDGYIMTAPMSLPRLAEGCNALEVRTNDRHGLRTVPWNQQVDFREPANVVAQFVSVENGDVKPYVKGWQQLCAKSGQTLKAVLRIAAPAGRSFAWAYVNAGIREAAPNLKQPVATLEFSRDGKSWTPFGKTALTCTPLQWDCSLDGEAMTDAAREVFFRVSTPTGISSLEFFGHLNGDHPAEQRDLIITHTWRDNDGDHKFEAPRNATRYTITCGKNPREHGIEMKAQAR